jgi:hypothetical protein
MRLKYGITDVGGHGVRVVPSDYHPEIPHEKTVEQVGKYAGDYGQKIRLENHGGAGDLVTLRKIMDGVDQLNGDMPDAPDFAQRFELVKAFLDDTLLWECPVAKSLRRE